MVLEQKLPWKKYLSECLGTFILVLFGVGTAVLTGNLVAAALAFGLSIVVVAYTFGELSGAHVNPCVSLVMFLKKKLSLKDFGFYILSQVVGAFVGALVVYMLAQTFVFPIDEFLNGCNAIGGAFNETPLEVLYTFVMEVILTFVFILVVLYATRKENKYAAIFIGTALTFVHLLGITGPSGTSVNPARSIGPAIVAMFAGEFTPILQSWMFIVAPGAGALIAYFTFMCLSPKCEECCECCKEDAEIEKPSVKKEPVEKAQAKKTVPAKKDKVE